MGKRNNVRNAFIIASNSREASNLTHGVSCNHPNCNDFDPNVRVGKVWYCEKHGGAKHHFAGANAKDQKFANGIPGSERRARIARFRARNKAPMHPGNAILFAQWEKEKKVTSTVIQPKAKVSKPKKSERQKMLESLGLTEADLSALRG